jgi:hypothetical protein
MQQDLTIEERIQAYIDQGCSEAERLFVEDKIATSNIWNEHYQAALAMHELLFTGLEPLEPSMRFTKNVMEDIAGLEIAKPIRLQQNPWIFRIAGGLLGTILLAIVAYSLSLLEFSSGSNLSIPAMQVPEVNWAGYLGQGTTLLLFMVCTILGLYLADKMLGKKLMKRL